MKAVLVMRECVLPAKGEVTVEVRAGLRALAEMELFTILLGGAHEGLGAGPAAGSRVAATVEAAGGKVDAVVWCPHQADSGCGCWGTRPGLILEAANRFDLQRNDCYLLGTTRVDLEMAAAAGVRPILVLGERIIGDILGDGSASKDFPVARTLSQAVEYIQVEERITAQVGRPRQALPPAPAEEPGRPAASNPAAVPISRAAVAANRRVRMRPREVGRWLSFLVVGGVWLSLGIAYLLTHLYREQPFPQVAWYITLQFIPRVARGVLFILTGVAVLVLASWNFWHTFGNGQAKRR